MVTRAARAVMVVAVSSLCSSAVAQEKSAWDTFSILEMKIGMPIEGKPGNLGFKRYGEKAPMGCHLDYSSSATYLDDDWKLFWALQAKYGEPTEKRSSIKVRWALDNTKMEATCTPNQNCEIEVKDSKFEDNGRSAQEEADAKQRRKSAPEAPKL